MPLLSIAFVYRLVSGYTLPKCVPECECCRFLHLNLCVPCTCYSYCILYQQQPQSAIDDDGKNRIFIFVLSIRSTRSDDVYHHILRVIVCEGERYKYNTKNETKKNIYMCPHFTRHTPKWLQAKCEKSIGYIKCSAIENVSFWHDTERIFSMVSTRQKKSEERKRARAVGNLSYFLLCTSCPTSQVLDAARSNDASDYRLVVRVSLNRKTLYNINWFQLKWARAITLLLIFEGIFEFMTRKKSMVNMFNMLSLCVGV